MFTDFAKNAILNELTGQSGTAFDFNNMYLALGTVSDGAFVELTAGSCPGYTRKIIGSPSSPIVNCFGPATSGAVVNTMDVTFARATADWTGVTITHGALFNALTGGSQITLDALSSSLSGIVTNALVVLPAGNFTISFYSI